MVLWTDPPLAFEEFVYLSLSGLNAAISRNQNAVNNENWFCRERGQFAKPSRTESTDLEESATQSLKTSVGVISLKNLHWKELRPMLQVFNGRQFSVVSSVPAVTGSNPEQII